MVLLRSTIRIPAHIAYDEIYQYEAIAAAFGDTPFGRHAMQRAAELRSAERRRAALSLRT
jgi:hypothetical protein